MGQGQSTPSSNVRPHARPNTTPPPFTAGARQLRTVLLVWNTEPLSVAGPTDVVGSERPSCGGAVNERVGGERPSCGEAVNERVGGERPSCGGAVNERVGGAVNERVNELWESL